MTPEEIKSMADQLKSEVDKSLKEKNDLIKTELAGEIQKKYDELLAKIPDNTKLTADFLELQKSVDAIAAEAKRIKGTPTEVKTFKTELSEKLKGESFRAYIERKKKGEKAEFSTGLGEISLHTKATVTPGTATASVVAPDQMTTIIHEPDRRLHIRDFITTTTTTSNRVIVPVEATITDGTATTAEGVQKGVSQFTLDVLSFPVQKIASVQKISEEMLDDIEGLASYISTRFGNKLKNKEDYELLYNTATSTEFGGLTVGAQAYVDVLASSATTRWDVLRAAVTQAITDEYRPTAIFLNPADVLQLRITKGSDQHYIGGSAPWNPAPLMCDGVPIIETTAIGADEFLVGDMAMGAQIFDRMSPSIRFYDQDEDNAQKNLITVVVEERLTLAIIRPNAFVYGDFTSALARGSA